jgi:hypothetical protein
MRMGRILLIAAALLMCSASAFAEGLVLQYKVHTVTVDRMQMHVPAGGGTPQKNSGTPKEEDGSYTVTLFPDAFVVNDGKNTIIYDYTHKRSYRVNEGTKQFTGQSLYAHVVFKGAERNNRLLMRKTLSAAFAGGKDKAAIPAGAIQTELEIDTALAGEKNATTSAQVTAGKQDGKNTFSADGKVMAEFTASDTPVPEALRRSYARFIVYQQLAHPVVKKALYSDPSVFKTLHYTHRDMGRERTGDWTLQSADASKTESPLPLSGYAEVISENPQLDSAIKKSRAAPAPSVEEYNKKIQSYLDQKDNLRAVLAAMDMTITHSADAMGKAPAAIAAFKSSSTDASTRSVLSAVARPPRSPEEFTQMVSAMDSARAAAPDYAYLLDLYQANHAGSWMRARGKAPAGSITTGKQAIEALERAIIHNPWAAGAYMDLGGIYFQSYDMTRAWTLFDEARRLSDGMPQMKGIAQMQAQAEKDYAEYF